MNKKWYQGKYRSVAIQRQGYNSYSVDYEKVFFDEKTGGYIVKHRGHKLDNMNGKLEMKSVYMLAMEGRVVEMMDESMRKPQYDAKVDNVPTEIKVMNGFRNIHKRAEQAAKQGAKRIIYYINFDDDAEIFNRFNNVYKTIDAIDEIWYIKDGVLNFYSKK